MFCVALGIAAIMSLSPGLQAAVDDRRDDTGIILVAQNNLLALEQSSGEAITPGGASPVPEPSAGPIPSRAEIAAQSRNDGAMPPAGAAPVSLSNLSGKMDRKIVLDLRDIAIIDVLKFLAQKGGISIVAGKNVQGKVTLYLNSVSIKDALDTS